MTVRELIDRLKHMHPDANVVIEVECATGYDWLGVRDVVTGPDVNEVTLEAE